MRKLFMKWKGEISKRQLKSLIKRKIKIQTQLILVEAAIDEILLPIIYLTSSMIPGHKSNPPKENKIKALCPKCYKYFFFEPSLAMYKGENIAYTNCPHCKADLVSFVSPELETGKNSVTWLRSEEKEKRQEMFNFIHGLAAINKTINNGSELENYYKQISESSNINGLFN